VLLQFGLRQTPIVKPLVDEAALEGDGPAEWCGGEDEFGVGEMVTEGEWGLGSWIRG
jgi:hypothetical protein